MIHQSEFPGNLNAHVPSPRLTSGRRSFFRSVWMWRNNVAVEICSRGGEKQTTLALKLEVFVIYFSPPPAVSPWPSGAPFSGRRSEFSATDAKNEDALMTSLPILFGCASATSPPGLRPGQIRITRQPSARQQLQIIKVISNRISVILSTDFRLWATTRQLQSVLDCLVGSGSPGPIVFEIHWTQSPLLVLLEKGSRPTYGVANILPTHAPIV